MLSMLLEQRSLPPHERLGRSFASTSEPQTQPEVEVSFRGRTFRAEPGQLLRTGERMCSTSVADGAAPRVSCQALISTYLVRVAMLTSGVSPHNGRAKLINCRGLGTCGTCAVQVSHTSRDVVLSCSLSLWPGKNDCVLYGLRQIEPPSAVEPQQWTTQESVRLNFPPHGAPNNARLRLVRRDGGRWSSSIVLCVCALSCVCERALR